MLSASGTENEPAQLPQGTGARPTPPLVAAPPSPNDISIPAERVIDVAECKNLSNDVTAACMEAKKAEYVFDKERLTLIKNAFDSQLFASHVILFLVVLVTVFGLIFSGFQLWHGVQHTKGKSATDKETAIDISLTRIKVTSSIVGLGVLAFSLIFLAIYCHEVYRLEIVEINKPDHSEKVIKPPQSMPGSFATFGSSGSPENEAAHIQKADADNPKSKQIGMIKSSAWRLFKAIMRAENDIRTGSAWAIAAGIDSIPFAQWPSVDSYGAWKAFFWHAPEALDSRLKALDNNNRQFTEEMDSLSGYFSDLNRALDAANNESRSMPGDTIN